MADGGKVEPTLHVVPQNAGQQLEGLAVLREALARLDMASRTAGVEPEEPLGSWMACLKSVLECSAQLTLQGEERLGALFAAFETAALAERAAMKTAADRCRAEAERIDRLYGTVETRAHSLVTQTIHSMADKVAEQLRDRTIIVERNFNRRRLWERASVIALLMVALVGGGAAWMRYDDAPKLGIVDQCLAHPFTDSSGQLYCALGHLPTSR